MTPGESNAALRAEDSPRLGSCFGSILNLPAFRYCSNTSAADLSPSLSTTTIETCSSNIVVNFWLSIPSSRRRNPSGLRNVHMQAAFFVTVRPGETSGELGNSPRPKHQLQSRFGQRLRLCCGWSNVGGARALIVVRPQSCAPLAKRLNYGRNSFDLSTGPIGCHPAW
jgi:hypothetical protein